MLLERGAQIDLRNRDGRTALHDALKYGRGSLTDLLIDETVQLRYTEHATRTVNVLLDAGADINALDADGKTPLDLAIETAESSDDHRRDFDALIALLQTGRRAAMRLARKRHRIRR